MLREVEPDRGLTLNLHQACTQLLCSVHHMDVPDLRR